MACCAAIKMRTEGRVMQMTKKWVLGLSTILFVGCAAQPPREVSTIETSNTSLLTAPTTSKESKDGINITYAQASVGFDTGCDINQTFSDDLNDCAKLPTAVKEMAIAHCDGHGRKAMFLGNGTSWLQQTVSKFRCDEL